MGIRNHETAACPTYSSEALLSIGENLCFNYISQRLGSQDLDALHTYAYGTYEISKPEGTRLNKYNDLKLHGQNGTVLSRY